MIPQQRGRIQTRLQADADITGRERGRKGRSLHYHGLIAGGNSRTTSPVVERTVLELDDIVSGELRRRRCTTSDSIVIKMDL